MPKKRRRVHRGGRPKRVIEKIDPTPETAAKLKADVLTELCRKGILGNDQEAAAWEILTVWRAIMRGMYPAMKTESERERSTGKVRDPFERMTPTERFYWEHHYKPWSNNEGRIWVQKFPRLTRFQLALSVIVENEDLEYLEQMFHVKQDDLIRALRATLDRYSMWQRKLDFRSPIVDIARGATA